MVTEEELLDMFSHTMSDYAPTLFHSNKVNMNFFNFSIEYDVYLFCIIIARFDYFQRMKQMNYGF